MRALEVFLVFLRLGTTSFGGPVAHLGYFRESLVRRRGWVAAEDYAALVALAHLLPGPSSSQVGFAIGVLRAGWLGGLAAFAGFTLPSAILMLACAMASPALLGAGPGRAVLHGLALAAVPVVGFAVIGMWRALCPDLRPRVIAVAASLLTLWRPEAGPAAIALGAGAGAAILPAALAPDAPPRDGSTSRWPGPLSLAAFAAFGAALVAVALLGSHGPPALALFAAFLRAGGLVFGGGHVVLPLLRQGLVDPGRVPPDLFLAAYGAAQAMPGPLFSVAAFLGAVSRPPIGAVSGALVALAGIFLPGLLLMAALLPLARSGAGRMRVRAAIAGAGAATVGLLFSAFIDPVLTAGVHGRADAVIAGLGLALLAARVSPLVVVAGSALASLACHG